MYRIKLILFVYECIKKFYYYFKLRLKWNVVIKINYLCIIISLLIIDLCDF